jgi:hypothetical protein
LNNGHLDEIDEDLTVFASGSGVISGEKQNQGDCSCDCADTEDDSESDGDDSDSQ